MNKVLYDIRTSELLSLVSDMSRQYKAASTEGLIAVVTDAVLSSLFKELETKYAELLLAFNRDRVRSTAGSADVVRDKLLRSLKKILSGYALFPDEAKSTAASRLLAVLKKYGSSLPQEKEDVEYSYVKSLIKDFSAAELLPSLAILPDTAVLIKALKQAQEDYMAQSLSYTKKLVEQGANATELKRPLIAIINERLVPYLNAVAAVSGYETFVARIALLVSRSNAAVQQRKKRASKAQDGQQSGEQQLELISED